MSLKDPNVVNPSKRKRIAILLSNPAVLSTIGWPVGFWWSELTHPYFQFTEAGYEIEVFSPKGGKCEADAMSDPHDPSGYSARNLISMGFIATPKLEVLTEDTKRVSEIDPDRFDAILVAGGQAPMFTFEEAIDLHRNVCFFTKGAKSPAHFATARQFFATPNYQTANTSPKAKRSPVSPMSKKISRITQNGV